MQRANSTSAQDAANAFEMNWLFKYPRPVQIIHDQGTEFMGDNFQSLLQRWGIRNAPISVRNPQANAVCKRMHQTVGNILLTLIHTNPPQVVQNAEQVIDYALQMAVYTLRTTVRCTAGASSGAIVFHRECSLIYPLS
jgi:transposase InsO family protein